MKVEIIQNDHEIVRVAGSVDMSDVGIFRAALDNAIRDSSDGLVVDMCGVNYIDSAGIQVILNAYRQMAGSGRRLILVVTHSDVRDILTITGIHLLPGLILTDNLDSANKSLDAERKDQH